MNLAISLENYIKISVGILTIVLKVAKWNLIQYIVVADLYEELKT